MAGHRARRVIGAFSIQRVVTHDAAAISVSESLTVTTPPGIWAYAVSLPSAWPADADWIHKRDGIIRVRMKVNDGCASVLATDAHGAAIDEIRCDQTDSAIDLELVSVPLAACRTLVFRNGRAGGVTRMTVHRIQCIELGSSEEGEDLAAPEHLTLRAVDEWYRYYGDSARSIDERRRGARYRRIDGIKRMPWLEHLEVYIHPNDDLSRAVYVSGLYEPASLLVLRRLLKRGAIFIDAGANAGLFSLVAARWVGSAGRVFSIEPSQREFDRLIAHLKLNRLTNVEAVREALGNREGVAALRVATFPNAGHNTLGSTFAYSGVVAERVETLPQTTIDRFVRERDIRRVDVIKLDIEGSEVAALKGSSQVLTTLRPVLIVEISPPALAACGSTTDQVRELLEASRYRPCSLTDAGGVVPLAPGEPMTGGEIVALPAERPIVL